MAFFTVEPEVAGGLGPLTVVRGTGDPPVIDHVHYIFDGWLGDALLESFPVFLISQVAAERIEAAELTGATSDVATIEMSRQFAELHPGRPLPAFRWLRLHGIAGRHDFAASADGRLVVSDRALTLLRDCGIHHALIEPWAE